MDRSSWMKRMDGLDRDGSEYVLGVWGWVTGAGREFMMKEILS